MTSRGPYVKNQNIASVAGGGCTAPEIRAVWQVGRVLSLSSRVYNTGDDDLRFLSCLERSCETTSPIFITIPIVVEQ